MFKRILFAGLVLMLVFGLAFQASPVLAMSPANGVVIDPNSPVLAQIQRVELLESYPPRLRIVGTLPASCYQLKVSIPQPGDDPNPSLGALPLTIWVRGVYLHDSVCGKVPKSFATTLTLDSVRLNLAPGKYVAMVNPVNGKSIYRAEFSVWRSFAEIVPITIQEMTILESYPPRYRISGSSPRGCYLIRATPHVTGNVISVVLKGYRPLGMLCNLTTVSFTQIVTLDPQKLGLAPGIYTVLFNPTLQGESRFKASLMIPK